VPLLIDSAEWIDGGGGSGPSLNIWASLSDSVGVSLLTSTADINTLPIELAGISSFVWTSTADLNINSIQLDGSAARSGELISAFTNSSSVLLIDSAEWIDGGGGLGPTLNLWASVNDSADIGIVLPGPIVSAIFSINEVSSLSASGDVVLSPLESFAFFAKDVDVVTNGGITFSGVTVSGSVERVLDNNASIEISPITLDASAVRSILSASELDISPALVSGSGGREVKAEGSAVTTPIDVENVLDKALTTDAGIDLNGVGVSGETVREVVGASSVVTSSTEATGQSIREIVSLGEVTLTKTMATSIANKKMDAQGSLNTLGFFVLGNSTSFGIFRPFAEIRTTKTTVDAVSSKEVKPSGLIITKSIQSQGQATKELKPVGNVLLENIVVNGVTKAFTILDNLGDVTTDPITVNAYSTKGMEVSGSVDIPQVEVHPNASRTINVVGSIETVTPIVANEIERGINSSANISISTEVSGSGQKEMFTTGEIELNPANVYSLFDNDRTDGSLFFSQGSGDISYDFSGLSGPTETSIQTVELLKASILSDVDFLSPINVFVDARLIRTTNVEDIKFSYSSVLKIVLSGLIDGEARHGSTITAVVDPALLRNSTSVDYQWEQDDVEINVADENSETINIGVDHENGAFLRCKVNIDGITYYTPAVQIWYDPPIALNDQENETLTNNTGIQTIDVSSYFIFEGDAEYTINNT
jgi:hypothetical protein